MSLLEIEKQVKSLSEAEKKQLIRDIQAMLVDEQIERHGDEMLKEMTPPGTVVQMESPGAFLDEQSFKAAAQLQQFIKEHEHEI